MRQPGGVTAVLHKLLLYEQGCFFKEALVCQRVACVCSISFYHFSFILGGAGTGERTYACWERVTWPIC